MINSALFVASGLIVAVALQRAFFATWRSTMAVVAVVLIWICWALALGQVLGAFGLLRRGPVLLVALASAAVAMAMSRHCPDRGPEPDAADGTSPTAPAQTLVVTTTALVVLLVAAIWVARTIIAVHRGITDPDSLGYHLPFATTFAQTGVSDQHRFVRPFLPVHFYPANDELLSAIALILTRSVAFAAVKNLLFGGFVLVAAHAVGKAFRAGALSVAAAAIVLGLPVIAFSQPGEAVNDSLALMALLGALACLAHSGHRPAPYVLALAGSGVALGVKFSAVIPAAALGLLALALMLIRVPRNRLRWGGTGVLVSLALGASWYLRNAITYGNPVPPAHLAIGPLHLQQIATASGPPSFSVLGFLVHGQHLGLFARGATKGLGPLVIVVAVLCAWGTVDGLRSPNLFRRGLGAFALVCLIGYLATPASAYGVGLGESGGFVINLHYAAPALLAGMVTGSIALAAWRGAWLLPVVGCVVVAAGVDSGRRIAFWSPEMGGEGFSALLLAALGGTAVVWCWTEPSRRRWATAGGITTAAIVVAAALTIADLYPSMPSVDPVERWAASVSGVRIAAWIGDVAWLYGPGSPNRVDTLTRLVDGAPVALEPCSAWMKAVRQGHYRFSAVEPRTPWYRWLSSDRAFQLVAQNDYAAVFRVTGEPDVGCRGQR